MPVGGVVFQGRIIPSRFPPISCWTQRAETCVLQFPANQRFQLEAAHGAFGYGRRIIKTRLEREMPWKKCLNANAQPALRCAPTRNGSNFSSCRSNEGGALIAPVARQNVSAFHFQNSAGGVDFPLPPVRVVKANTTRRCRVPRDDVGPRGCDAAARPIFILAPSLNFFENFSASGECVCFRVFVPIIRGTLCSTTCFNFWSNLSDIMRSIFSRMSAVVV